MKKTLFLILTLLISTNLIGQTVWNQVWNMQQMPFQQENRDSEMSIVKAGFDTDEDGWGEFICGNSDMANNYIMMYEATANDTYELVWYWEFPLSANTFPGIAVGDIDNNGTVEIVVGLPSVVSGSNPNPPRVFTFEWNGTQGENKYGRDNGDGTFSPTNETYFDIPENTDWRPYSMIIEDVDKDGKNELVIGVRRGDRGREVFVASTTGSLSAFGAWVTEYNFTNIEGGSNYCTAIGDLDNDGNTEIFQMIWNYFTLRMFEITAPNTYEHVNNLEQIYADSNIDYGALDGLKIADINGDGSNELFIAGTEEPNSLFLIQNISDISTITAEDVIHFYTIPVKKDGKLRSMHIADPDQDGNLSLMIAGERNGQIFDLEYKGTGALENPDSWVLTVAYDIFEEAAQELGADSAMMLTPRLFYGSPANDMDKDGLNEYVFVNYSSDKNIWGNDAYVRVIEADIATSVSSTNSLIPTRLTLEQNYPNPFNPSTMIKFSTPKRGLVTLKIFNVLGEEVAELVNDVKSAGSYEVLFDASNLPTGLYIYNIQMGIYNATKKMLLIK